MARQDGVMIECLGVTKRFYAYEHRTTSLQEALLRVLRPGRAVPAPASFEVRDLSLSIQPGEAVALIGGNGSGKSTALRLMAGIYPPSAGRVVRRGRVVAVIELGATFHTDLPGQTNVELYAAALGMSRREITARVPEILAFADLGDFINVPLKYYSSGMRARLAFAAAVCSEPDVLLLDEVLAVGDARFRERCLARLQSFHAAGGTLVVVSHDLELLGTLCHRALWLEAGRVRAEGEAQALIREYLAASHDT
jgi:lipopolysaccharide transport system ATP-binding protein